MTGRRYILNRVDEICNHGRKARLVTIGPFSILVICEPTSNKWAQYVLKYFINVTKV